jgi:hypothetical protein
MRRCLLTLVLLLTSAPAFAQQMVKKPEAFPLFVFDARGTFTLLKADAVTADSLNLKTTDLPAHAFGAVGGVQMLVLRRKTFALGVGSDLLLVGASAQETDTDGKPIGPEVHRRLQSFSGQLSLNFGHPSGWSYLTAGMGPVNFDTYLDEGIPDGLRPMTTNAGFGARWFGNDHVAFNLDMRFYLTAPANPTEVVGKRERTMVVVLSAGISIK